MNHVVVIKAAQFTRVKNKAERDEIVPAGISRVCVRGFNASILRSAHLLNAIALVRANTIQSSTLKPRLHVKDAGNC